MRKAACTLTVLILLAAGQALAQDAKFHDAFTENFSKETSEYFDYNYRPSGHDFRYYSGIRSFSEEGTDVMLYRIDPADPAGAGKGPEIISKDYTFYGSDDFTRTMYKLGDHYSFNQKGIPALLFTSGFHQHTLKTSDTPEIIDHKVLLKRTTQHRSCCRIFHL